MGRHKKKIEYLKNQILESAANGKFLNVCLSKAKTLCKEFPKNELYQNLEQNYSEEYDKAFKKHAYLLQDCNFKLKLKKEEFLFPEKVR